MPQLRSLVGDRRRALTAVLAALAAVVLAAGSAQAGVGIACPDPTAKVFLRWGDVANYAFAPNGGLERGGEGWTFAGPARVVAGNEPFRVHGADDRYSLALGPGASATTAPMCV